mmetsp:Transcript_70033/g.104214  ORF Transcript_70033/g.104214 Transcript_70033/m.104214 type:complete len:85 (-) Transcript_70033:125-379(-)
MACSSCDAITTISLEASLQEFTSLLGHDLSLSSRSCIKQHSDEETLKKKKLDHFLSTHEETSTYTLPSLSMFPPAHTSSSSFPI